MISQSKTIQFAPLIEKMDLERVVGRIDHPGTDTLAIISTGIHGNEPSGLFAARHMLRKIGISGLKLKGTLIVLAGNLQGLEQHVRYIEQDLNRIWTEESIRQFSNKPVTPEQKEAREIRDIVLHEKKGYKNLFFLDCHTTSSETIPYISAHDEAESYEFALQFPLYTVVGFSNHVPGSIDDFFRAQGFTGFTFEAGQHKEFTSLENQEAMMWLFLCRCGLIDPAELTDGDECRRMLAKYIPEGRKLFRIEHRHALSGKEHFTMKPGFINFQQIEEGQELATENGKPVKAPFAGRVLMPLYQKQGNDGFFLIKAHHSHN